MSDEEKQGVEIKETRTLATDGEGGASSETTTEATPADEAAEAGEGDGEGDGDGA